MDQAKLNQLVKKYIDGLATPAEEEELLQWYRQTSNRQTEWISNEPDEEAMVRHRILVNINQKINSRPVKSYKTYYAAVASVLFFLSVSALFYFRSSPVSKVATRSPFVVRPGKNQAVLILSNGSKIVLNDNKSGVLAKQGSVVIKRSVNGQILYDLSALKNAPGPGAIAFNTIITPRGGQYQVILPDGSNVWLNSESSLKFPTTFTGKERRVKLTGEAYFEVAKNKQMPFRVDARGTQVEVLGTHFDIMGYDGEPTINTTLVEGSVKVSHNNYISTIKPGQQAQVGNTIAVEDVDAEQFIAWKNGMFVFNDENIHTLMNRIARWYDIDVAYEGNINDLRFTGSISKYKDVSQILKKMELTKTVRFKVEGRRITVMK